MVMGPTHAMSGAAAWLLVAPPIAGGLGHQLSVSQILIGAGLCAGSALLPDIDSLSSTVSRSLGPVTVALSHVVRAASVAFYNLTATHRDSPREGGHRTMTHTALFAVLLGIGVSTLCVTVGKWAVLGTLFFTLSLAIRGLMHDWAHRNGWVGVTAAAAALTWAATQFIGDQSFWWLGFSVAFGCLLHDLGDMITKEGAPITAPLPHRGKAWWDWDLPWFLRIRAGGWFEYALLLPACTGVAVLTAVELVSPGTVGTLLAGV